MLNDIPFGIQVQIIEKLPVRSLIQFRSVSKTWKSLIDSSDFIAAHTLRHNHPHHLLVRYNELSETEDTRYVSIVDDDTFPHNKSTLAVPQLFGLLNDPIIVGSSHGLICLYGYFDDPDDPSFKIGTAVLWNPSIRKSYPIIVPYLYESYHDMVLGFGVCPVTINPKIVMITRLTSLLKKDVNASWEIKVDDTLNSGGWRSLSSNLPPISISVNCSQVVVDRFIYWLAEDIPITGALFQNLILSFDMTNEKFGVIDLPDGLAQHIPWTLYMYKLRESLAVLEYNNDIDDTKLICDVWMMMGHCDGVQKSFAKLYTIKTPHASIKTLGFRKSGEALIETDGYWSRGPTFFSYEPNSKSVNDTEILAIFDSIVVNSYVETLLLLGQPYCDSD